jgi:hypothetical protein
MHPKDILITALGMETFGKLCRRAQYYKQITHGALSQASEHPRKCKYMKSEFMALENKFTTAIEFCPKLARQTLAIYVERKKVTFALPPGGPARERRLFIVGRAEKTMFVFGECVCKFSPSL